MDLLIPYALSEQPGARAALRAARLPHLHALLGLLRAQPLPALAADSLVTMDEALQARQLGLDPQAPPWAALRAHALGLPAAADDGWAFLHLTHWDVGTASVTLHVPPQEDVPADEAQALRAAMQPYFAQDGLQLHPDQPTRWLVQGAALRSLRSASLARVQGRDVAPWLPAAAWLRRLQTEMQMLLYTHPVADARAQRKAMALNGFWLDGAGALAAQPPAPQPAPQVFDELVRPALAGDLAGWARAWQALDARLAAPLQAARAGQAVTLTLCGELHACRYGPARRSWWGRLRPPEPSEILSAP